MFAGFSDKVWPSQGVPGSRLSVSQSSETDLKYIAEPRHDQAGHYRPMSHALDCGALSREGGENAIKRANRMMELLRQPSEPRHMPLLPSHIDMAG